jgi:hypothetical protein
MDVIIRIEYTDSEEEIAKIMVDIIKHHAAMASGDIEVESIRC